MVQTRPRFYSFDDYLVYDDGAENFYELFNRELIEVPPESGQNVQIANRLFLILALVVGIDRVRGHGLELEVRGEPKNRYPHLTVIQPEHVQLLAQRNTIRLTMPPPALLVEVVSPGELQPVLIAEVVSPYRGPADDNYRRDYIDKRQQYEQRRIPECWIVDPIIWQITVLIMQDKGYQERVYAGQDRVISAAFPTLQVTVDEIFG